MKSVIKLYILSTLILLNISGLVAQSSSNLPKSKQTSLGLYLDAKTAYDRWQKNPDKIKILDVRTIAEYVWVGHAPMATNIPLMFASDTWNTDRKSYSMTPNMHFVDDVKSRFSPSDTLFVICRSGGRSAKAVNQLAKAGFTNTYSIFDGFEGDFNAQAGKRNINGWQNSGAPVTSKLDENLIYKK